MLRESLATPVRGNAAAAAAVLWSGLLVAGVAAVGLWAGATTVDPRAGLLLPLAVVPFLLLRGYGVRVVACGLRGDPSAPTFSRPGVLLRDGVTSTLLGLLLLVPLWVVLVVGGASAGVVSLGRVDAAGVATELSAAVAGFTGLVALGWLAAYAYLRPAALACLADERRLRDGLHPGKLLRVALDGDYLKGWVLGSLVLATGVLVAIPFVPLVVGLPLLFAVTVASNSLYGRGAAGALRGGVPGGPEPAPGGAEQVDPSPAADSTTETEPPSATPADHPPGSDEILEAPEPNPAVQTGRRVPLTATDILSKSVGTDTAAPDSEPTPDTGADAADRAAGVDDSGELVDAAREPETDRRRSGPDETGFAWGATEPSEGEGGDGRSDGEGADSDGDGEGAGDGDGEGAGDGGDGDEDR